MADRLIVLKRCEDCEHRRSFRTYYCAKDPSRRAVELHTIPNWCPLPLANTATLANTAKGGK